MTHFPAPLLPGKRPAAPSRREACALLLGALALPVWAADPPKPGKSGEPRLLRWDELVPKGWDPMKRFKDTNMGTMVDGTPQAAAMMKELREVWDNAPTVPEMNDQFVRLPGYLVPLDDAKAGLKEFLLVPYFGACIHTPPPPANQIVHVLSPNAPVKGFRSMDAVWVNGRLKAAKLESDMGHSAYRLEAVSVERYVAPERR